MALYCIADLHLSEAVPKSMEVFGSRWQGYTEKIIRNWNTLIAPTDTVIVPGDISWGLCLEEAKPDLALLSSLNGEKIIGKGNHDLWWQSAQKIHSFFAEEGIGNIRLLHNNGYILGDKVICGSRGWFCDPKCAPKDADPAKIAAREAIRTELSIKAALALPDAEGKELIAFFHFPPVFKGFVCRDIVDLLHRYGIRRCYYGHIHSSYDLPPKTVFEEIEMHIVSADYLGFYPLLVR